MLKISSFTLLQNKIPLAGAHFESDHLTSTAKRALLTLEKDSVQVFDVYDQKVTKSWTHGPGINFTLPVVHHGPGFFFIGVRDRRSILCWTETQEDVKRSVSLKFNEDIIAVFAFPHTKDLLLSVFSNGKVLILRFDKENQNLNEVATLEDCMAEIPLQLTVIKKVFFTPSEQASRPSQLLLLGKRNEGHHQLVVAEIGEPESPTISAVTVHKFPPIQSTLVSAAYDGKKRLLSFLWQNNLWQAFSFETYRHLMGHLKEAGGASYIVKCSILLRNLQLPLPLPNDVKDNFESLVTDTYFIYVAKKTTPPTRDPGDTERHYATTLFFWDIHYRALVATHDIFIEDTPKPITLGPLRTMRLTTDKSAILIGFQNAVFCCSVHLPPSTLASVMGKMDQTLTYIIPDLAGPHKSPLTTVFDLASNLIVKRDPEEELDVLVQTDLFFNELADQDRDEEKWIRKLSSVTSAPPPEEEFTKNVKEYIAKRKRATLSLYEQQQRLKRQEISSEETPKVATISHEFLSQVVPRCISLGYWTALQDLIRTDLISSTAFPTLLPALVAKNNLSVIETCLLRLSDISERDLSYLLSYLVSPKAEPHFKEWFETLEEYRKKNYERHLEKFSWYPSYFVNLVMSRNHSRPFVQYHLKALSTHDVIALLRYYLVLMKNEELLITPENRKATWLKAPKLSLVVRWVSSLLDSHFTDLVLLPECHQQLRELYSLVQEHLSFNEAVEEFKYYLSHVIQTLKEGEEEHEKEHRAAMRSLVRPDYSVEVWYFK